VGLNKATAEQPRNKRGGGGLTLKSLSAKHKGKNTANSYTNHYSIIHKDSLGKERFLAAIAARCHLCRLTFQAWAVDSPHEELQPARTFAYEEHERPIAREGPWGRSDAFKGHASYCSGLRALLIDLYDDFVDDLIDLYTSRDHWAQLMGTLKETLNARSHQIVFELETTLHLEARHEECAFDFMGSTKVLP